jgi:hypothetical protein
MLLFSIKRSFGQFLTWKSLISGKLHPVTYYNEAQSKINILNNFVKLRFLMVEILTF